ncbi:unnamed protein product [Diatraea saccharalis]|uniref:DUF4806 domain-containing protein n=1 Tax=Diatraea saccharalis TaxID=40085 RepID=A0A9N9QUH6_9NEOP|nr:unnamed protein product [Diatraea saccharalis]
MSGFKIVQTLEKGSNRLFIIPSKWEHGGLLRYPKKPIEYKLAKNENSKPRDEWPIMSCKVKRIGLLTYADAEEELNIMLQNSDTDVGGHEDQRLYTITTAAPPPTSNISTNYNDMASHLMLQAQVDVCPTTTKSSTAILAPQADQEQYFYVNNIATTEIIPPPSSHDQFDIMQKLDTILTNQNDIKEIQKRFAQRLGNFVLEMETKVEEVIKRTLNHTINRTVTSLDEAKASPYENSAFKLKPINNIEELEEFELLLLDPIEKHKLMQLLSILCTKSDGNGITCAYKLIDIIFTREFLCKCSWSGGSRGDKIKIALKGYKNLLDFFFRMILSWDKSFTTDKNENFFKLVLRNAEQRKNIKNLRKPAMRTRKSKTQTNKEETVTSNEKKDEQVVENESAVVNAEKEKDLEEMEKDSEKEVQKDLEEGVEKNLDEEVEKNLDEEVQKNLEEEVQKDLEEEVQKDLEEEVERDLEEVVEKKRKK